MIFGRRFSPRQTARRGDVEVGPLLHRRLEQGAATKAGPRRRQPVRHLLHAGVTAQTATKPLSVSRRRTKAFPHALDRPAAHSVRSDARSSAPLASGSLNGKAVDESGPALSSTPGRVPTAACDLDATNVQPGPGADPIPRMSSVAARFPRRHSSTRAIRDSGTPRRLRKALAVRVGAKWCKSPPQRGGGARHKEGHLPRVPGRSTWTRREGGRRLATLPNRPHTPCAAPNNSRRQHLPAEATAMLPPEPCALSHSGAETEPSNTPNDPGA